MSFSCCAIAYRVAEWLTVGLEERRVEERRAVRLSVVGIVR